MKVCGNALETKQKHQDLGAVETDVEYEMAGKYENSKGPLWSGRGRLLLSPLSGAVEPLDRASPPPLKNWR